MVDIRRIQSFFSFLGLAPIDKNAWADHTKKIEGVAKLLLEKELNRASRDVKEWTFSCYMLPVKVLLLEKIDPSLISIRINI